MFAKLALLVVAIGACGCSLLALRQQRLQVASELTRAQLRIQAADERLWELRAKIALHTTPRAIRVLANDLGPMKPVISIPTGLPADWVVADGREVLPLVPRLNEPAGTPARSRAAIRTTQAAPGAQATKASRNAAPKPATPSTTRAAQSSPPRRPKVPTATRANASNRSRTLPPSNSAPPRVARTDEGRR